MSPPLTSARRILEDVFGALVVPSPPSPASVRVSVCVSVFVSDCVAGMKDIDSSMRDECEMASWWRKSKVSTIPDKKAMSECRVCLERNEEIFKDAGRESIRFSTKPG